MAVESTASMRSTDPSPASLPPLGAAGLVHTKPMATPQYIPTLASDYRQDLGEVMLNDGSIGYLQTAAPATYFACPPVQLARHTSLPVSMMRTTTPIAHFIQQAPPTAEMAAMPPALGRQRSLGFIMHPQPTAMQHYNVPRLVAYPPSLVHVSTPMQSQAPLNVTTSQQSDQQQRLQSLPLLPTMTKMEQGGQAPGVEPIAFNGRLSEARMSLGEIDSLALAVLSEPSDDRRDDGLRFSTSQKFSNASSVGCAQDLQKALESLDKLMPDVGENGDAPRFSFPNARGSLPMLISPQLKNPNVSPSACMSMLVIDPSQQQTIKTSPKPIAFCKVAGCGRRVRSKGFCKTHGGGRKCSIEGCKKSSQNGEFCIGHGGGKKCKQEGCAKAAQSHGLCKAHGGGARCKYPNCNKSSQGGGLCRAHGGGKRCQAAGCPKGAQRGNFCATHGGFRNCKIEGCVRTDRGGGFCEVHRRGRLCKVEGCKKLARNQGMCTMHIREERQDTGADPMTQLVTPVA